MKEQYQSRLPLAIACSDIDGTRYGNGLGEVKNLHLHSLWVFRPGDRIKVQDHIHGWSGKPTFHSLDFDQIDCEVISEYDVYDGVPSRLASYASKFTAMNGRDAKVAEDIQVWPRYLRGPQSASRTYKPSLNWPPTPIWLEDSHT